MTKLMQKHLYCFRAVALQPLLELGPPLPAGFYDPEAAPYDPHIHATATVKAPLKKFEYKVRSNANRILAE